LRCPAIQMCDRSNLTAKEREGSFGVDPRNVTSNARPQIQRRSKEALTSGCCVKGPNGYRHNENSGRRFFPGRPSSSDSSARSSHELGKSLAPLCQSLLVRQTAEDPGPDPCRSENELPECERRHNPKHATGTGRRGTRKTSDSIAITIGLPAGNAAELFYD